MNEMSLSKTYTKVFRLFGKNFGKLLFGAGIPIGIGMAPLIVLMSMMLPNMIELVQGYASPAASFFFLKQFVPLFVGLGCAFIVLFLLGSAFAISYLTNFAAKAEEGNILTIREAVAGAWKSFGRMLLTYLAYLVLAVIVLGIVFGGLVFGMYRAYSQSAYGTLLILAMILFLAALGLVYLVLHFFFSYPAVVLEKRSGFGALFHGFRIFVKGGYGRNLGHILLMMLALSAASSIVTGIFSLAYVAMLLYNASTAMALMMILATAMEIIMMMILIPLYTIEYKNSQKYIAGKEAELEGEEK